MSTGISEVREWLIEWFHAETVVSESTIREQTNQDYLKNEWIDSMQFIGMIATIEEEFGIEFSNDEFQNRSFATVDGLAELIADKIQKS